MRNEPRNLESTNDAITPAARGCWGHGTRVYGDRSDVGTRVLAYAYTRVLGTGQKCCRRGLACPNLGHVRVGPGQTSRAWLIQDLRAAILGTPRIGDRSDAIAVGLSKIWASTRKYLTCTLFPTHWGQVRCRGRPLFETDKNRSDRGKVRSAAVRQKPAAVGDWPVQT